MRSMKRSICFFVAVLFTCAALADDGTLRFAALGDFTLESGEVIRDCRIGYRTYGQIAPDRSNVIVLTTWFIGTSEDLGSSIGAGKLFDTSKFFVVAIDALGNGVSSSPSNSSAEPDERFPRFTIRDMVRSQHELLTRDLKLEHVYAVSGLSMGGMQTFQWIVSYPGFMEKAIPIVGTPRQTSYDLLLWKTELGLLESLRDVPDGGARAIPTLAAIQALELRTPAYIVAHTTPEGVADLMKTHQKSIETKNPLDYASQLRAMIAHDIYRDFGGSAESAAKAIKAKLLVIISLQDHMVNPTPSRELARLVKAKVVTLTSDCGHLASGCERKVLTREVWRFLGK